MYINASIYDCGQQIVDSLACLTELNCDAISWMNSTSTNQMDDGMSYFDFHRITALSFRPHPIHIIE